MGIFSKKKPQIDTSLEKLLKKGGFMVVTINDLYVQFAYQKGGEHLNFEAVSHNFLPRIGQKQEQFKSLGFELDPKANYFKLIPVNQADIQKLIVQLEEVFTQVYRVSFANYDIELVLD